MNYIDLSLSDVAIVVLAVFVAYMVFSLAGFGTALVASSPMANVMPVTSVIPILAILDCVGATHRAYKLRTSCAFVEIKPLFVGMVIGQLFGVSALTMAPPALMAVLLGGFVILQGALGLKGRQVTEFIPIMKSATSQGIIGGVLGGLFGSGGFIYAAYLDKKLEDRNALRASQAVLIGLSTAWRLILCGANGLLNISMLETCAFLFPVMLTGMWAGKHIDLRINRSGLTLVINALLVISGIALVARHV